MGNSPRSEATEPLCDLHKQAPHLCCHLADTLGTSRLLPAVARRQKSLKTLRPYPSFITHANTPTQQP